MLKIKGATDLAAKLARTQLKVETFIAKKVEDKVTAIFRDVTRTTPQWSGNLVTNWSIDFGPYTGRYYEHENYINPLDFKELKDQLPHYKMGKNPAMDRVRGEELPKLKTLVGIMFSGDKKTFKIKIVNHTPYAASVQLGLGPFPPRGTRPKPIRLENILEEYGAVAMKGYVLQSNAMGKYPMIGK